jgi:hypothetical protein
VYVYVLLDPRSLRPFLGVFRTPKGAWEFARRHTQESGTPWERKHPHEATADRYRIDKIELGD